MSLTKKVNGKEYILSSSEENKLLAEWAEEDLKKENYNLNESYKDKRKHEYPTIGDQLDAILKTLNYMQLNGQTDLVSDLDTIIGKWLSVKSKYPKPSQ